MVDAGLPYEHYEIPPSLSIHVYNQGCPKTRVGSPSRGPVHCRHLVSTTKSSPHQPTGTPGCGTRTGILPIQGPEPSGPGSNGQLHSGIIHQPPRRNLLSVEGKKNSLADALSRVKVVVPPSSNRQAHLQYSQGSTHRSVCIPPQPSASNLLFTPCSHQSMDSGCTQL